MLSPKTNALYRELMKRAVTNYLYLGAELELDEFKAFDRYYERRGRRTGWTIGPLSRPTTLLGLKQLDRIEAAMLETLRRKVPGDYLEAGVWNGGATVFMAAVLESMGMSRRRSVWVCDSFAGIPPSRYVKGDPVDLWPDRWCASLSTVRGNFRRFGLLGPNVRFVRGSFERTLHRAGIGRLALARLDGDSYESTMVALAALYPKLSVGGYLIIDDWHLPSCRQAVLDFRDAFGISERIDESVNAQWRISRPWRHGPVRLEKPASRVAGSARSRS